MSETHEGYPAEDIETGKRIMGSTMTGNIYLVTRWVTRDDGSHVSLSKTEVALGDLEDEELRRQYRELYRTLKYQSLNLTDKKPNLEEHSDA